VGGSDRKDSDHRDPLSVHGMRASVRDNGADSSQNHRTPQRGGGSGGGGAVTGLGATREDSGGPWTDSIVNSSNSNSAFSNAKRRQAPSVQSPSTGLGHGTDRFTEAGLQDGNCGRSTTSGGGSGTGGSQKDRSGKAAQGGVRGRSRPGRGGGGGTSFHDGFEDYSTKREAKEAAGHNSHGGVAPSPANRSHPALTGQTICPTPYVLGSVCSRGEREYPHWRGAMNSTELLGNHAQMMVDTAKYVFDIVVGPSGSGGGGSSSKTLRLLSAADGCADDMLPDIQAKYVPTSVMLAHTFLTGQGAWQEGRAKVQLYGGDLRNAIWPWWQQQNLPWRLPGWLGHRFVGLDNCRDFSQQLYSSGQCQEDMRFDAVLVRQGLCFCDDPSKLSSTWPIEVAVTQAQEGPVCGIYQLEPFTHEGRPAYRKGNCVLQWCPARGEWAILDESGGAWAYARADVGHPVLARGPWNVWNGNAHVSDATFACNLAQYGTPPWQRPVSQRICCAGITGDMESVATLLLRISAVLDPYNFHSFALVHGAWTNGTRTEVDELHRHIEDASRLYNSQRRGPHVAAVLRRTAASHNHYWLQCDGIILFQPGSRGDPYAAYGPGAVFDNTLSFYNPNPLPGSAQ